MVERGRCGWILPQELERRLLAVDYVEPTHQVIARTAEADVQVWIADTDRPAPLRVMTYPNELGRPQYRAELPDWTLRPEVSKSRFEFTPLADARRILI